MSNRFAENAAPPHATVEDCSDSQDEIPETRPPPNSARKVTRRDAASDSGYSSRTQATASSTKSAKAQKPSSTKSTSGSVMKALKKVSGSSKKSSKEAEPASKTPTKAAPTTERRPSIIRRQGSPDLRRRSVHIQEGREDAARINLTGEPVKPKVVAPPVAARPKSARPQQPPPIKTQSIQIPKGPPRPGPYPSQQPRVRPKSYHAGVPIYGHSLPLQQPQYMMTPGQNMVPQYQYQQMHHPQQNSMPTAPTSVPHGYAQRPHLAMVPSGPSSPGRTTAYSFEPTLPPGLLSYKQPQPSNQHMPAAHSYTGHVQSRRFSLNFPGSSTPHYPPSFSSSIAGDVYGDRPSFAEPMRRHPSDGYERQSILRSAGPVAPEPPLFMDDEDYYLLRERADRQREAMPPPPRPIYPRSSTTPNPHPPVHRSTQRRSTDMPLSSSRRPSMEGGRPPLSSQSSGSVRYAQDYAQSPTEHRRTHSRPTSYHEPLPTRERGEREAEEYLRRTAGPSPNVGHDDLRSHELSRTVSRPKTTRSGPSEPASRGSSKSDKKSSKRVPSERARRENEGVVVRIGETKLQMQGSGQFNITMPREDKVPARTSESRVRDGRDRERRSSRYITEGSNGGAEAEVNRTSRPTRKDTSKAVDAVQRVKTSSKNSSRRSSTTRAGVYGGPNDGIPWG